MVEIRVIAWSSKEYDLEVQLRSNVLRKPLGLVLTVDELTQDRADTHIAAFSANQLAVDQGYRELVLHARETVVSFYESLHYQVEGERFIEVGIPHLRMVKKIGKGA
jgi:predicted GNAT family N-acyltransferase